MRCDFDFPGLQLLHRVIPTMVSELQLECFAAQCNSRQLMPQTNSKDRLPAHEPADGIHCVCTRLGIAGAVREEYSVRLQSEHFFCRSLRGDHRHLTSFA